jgi:hypothetical protein
VSNAFFPLGRALMVLGGILFVAGLAFSLGGRVPLIGRLPGDFVFRRGSFTFYLPLATCLALSLLLTLLLALLRR